MMGWGLAVAAIVIAADQLTKWWILDVVMNPPRVIPIADFFNLVLVGNRGISFGLFAGGMPAWAFAVLSGVIVAALLIWLRRAGTIWLAVAIGLIVGGAIGNVIDRLRLGLVVDFLDFHVAGYHWPAFNLADSAITIGVVALIVDSFIEPKTRHGRTNQKRG